MTDAEAESSSEAATVNRSVTVSRFGGPDVLDLQMGPIPRPGPGEVLMRVEATSLVFTDMLIRRDLYPMLDLSPPFTVGYDLVGRIVALGEGVTDRRVGERVADLLRVGAACDYVVRPAAGLAPVPDEIDAAVAEVMILSYLTAWQPLVRLANAPQGASVLVTGAAGAVGTAALDIGRALGFRMTGVAGERDRARIEGYGAGFLSYDSPTEALDAAAHQADYYDVILDGAGAEPYPRLTGRLRRGGLLVAIGFAALMPRGRGSHHADPDKATVADELGRRLDELSRHQEQDPSRRALFYEISATRKQHPDWFVEDLASLFELARSGRLSPTIAAIYRFDEVVEGHRRLEAGRFAGRLVLVP